MLKHIVHIVVGLPLEGHFDYVLPPELCGQAEVGMRVLVSFARRKMVGIIVGFAAGSSFPKLNPVLALLDEAPVFSPAFLDWAEVFALHFGCSLGEALLLSLPPYLRGPKKLLAGGSASVSPRVEVGGRMSAAAFMTLVFDRGLGRRWEILGPLMAEVLGAGKGILCAVPDATLLDSVVSRLRELGMSPVLLSHGTDKDEYAQWNALREGSARVAVGFISAVLAPVRDLGLIVIFEEESPFYKHDQSPFYHAREAAFLRARMEGCRVVLVTSAPSVEAWHAAGDGGEGLKLLEETLPPVKFVDLQNFKIKKDTFLSPPLRQHLEAAARDGRQVLLFIQAARGVGGVVAEVRGSFPGLRVAGYDRAATDFPSGAQVVVATQAIFRYRYKIKFDLAVVLDIDWEFHKSDYRAAHGVFALTQHLRQMAKEFVLLQTRHMENEFLHWLAADDFRKFYARELVLRQEMGLPPFRYLVALVVRSSDPQLACDEAKRLYDSLISGKAENVEVHEPQQDRSAIVRGKFRWCVMVQGRPLKTVMGLVKDVKRSFRGKRDVVVTVNVNP